MTTPTKTTPPKTFKKKINTAPVKVFELDETAVAEMTVPVEDVIISTGKKRLFQCEHCGSSFLKDGTFFRHVCTGKLRSDAIKTETGQHAFKIYKHWALKQYSNNSVSIETFKNASGYFNSFMSIAQCLEERTNVIAEELFIETAVGFDMSPTLWVTSGNIHSGLFSAYHGKLIRLPNDQQCKLSRVSIASVAFEHGLEYDDYLAKLHPNDVLSLLRTGGLCPAYVMETPELCALLQHLEKDEQEEAYAIVRTSRFAQDTMTQVRMSLNSIRTIADAQHIEVKEFISGLTPYDVFNLVMGAKVAPVYVLFSEVMREKLMKLPPDTMAKFGALHTKEEFNTLTSNPKVKAEALRIINYKEGEF